MCQNLQVCENFSSNTRPNINCTVWIYITSDEPVIESYEEYMAGKAGLFTTLVEM
jgi:hypothetical protein